MANNKKTSFLTGGGPSIMKAWLEEPFKLGATTGAMALKLPHEPVADGQLLTKDENFFYFDTFQARKLIMMQNAKAIIVFKGGFGTLDELFEAFTLIQTKKIDNVPIFVYPADFYKDILNFNSFLEEKTISEKDLDLFHMINDKEELIQKLCEIM